jgi:hypothetical protein
MIITLPGLVTNQIKVYVRAHLSDQYTIDVYNEHTKKTTSEGVTGVYDGTSFTFDTDYQFEKQRWYMMKLFAGLKLINHSKIYCTDQTDFEKYSVLDGYYHQIDKPDHEYIIKKDE